MALIEENSIILQDYIDRIERFDKKLSDLDSLMKDIDNELHKKNQIQKSTKSIKLDDNDGFNILYVHKKLLEAERDRLILKKEFDDLIDDKKNFNERLKKLEEGVQELKGGLNQIRMSLSKITKENQERTEAQKKTSNIFWSIVIPIIVSILIFLISLIFKSCNTTLLRDFEGVKNNTGVEYIDIQ